MKIINEIKKEYNKNKVATLFMVSVLILAILTFLKPGSTGNLLNYIGISVINFFILTLVISVLWFIFIRKGWKFK